MEKIKINNYCYLIKWKDRFSMKQDYLGFVCNCRKNNFYQKEILTKDVDEIVEIVKNCLEECFTKVKDSYVKDFINNYREGVE